MGWLTPLSSSASVAARYLRNEYILLNVAIILTYYVFRMERTEDRVDIKLPFQYRDGKLFRSSFSTLHTGSFSAIEAQVAASLVLTALARSYRTTSADALIATILGNCQLFVLVNSALTDRVAAVWYLLTFGLVFLLFNEPVYTGPSKVEAMTAQLFMEQCLKDKGDGVAYAVMFQTSWSSRCRHAYPMFAELSLRYATDKLRFARVDVGTWPRLARTLNLDLSATSSQLPTVAIFEKGEEAGRIPAGSKASLSGSAKYTFSKVQLITALELDSRYARSMGTAPAPSVAPGPTT